MNNSTYPSKKTRTLQASTSLPSFFPFNEKQNRFYFLISEIARLRNEEILLLQDLEIWWEAGSMLKNNGITETKEEFPSGFHGEGT